MSPAWRPARHDPDGTVHRDVAHAADYDVKTPLYRREVAGGTVTCYQLRSRKPAKRLVQLEAEYTEAGILTTHIIHCEDLEDEVRQLERLERIIREASRKPEITDQQMRRASKLRRAAAAARGLAGLRG
jgi:hypothetical protein